MQDLNPHITGVSFSPMGAGKTLEAWRTFPTAICLCVPEAVRTVALSVAGYEPPAIWPWLPVYEGDPWTSDFKYWYNAATENGLPEQIRHTDDQIEVLDWISQTPWVQKQFGAVLFDDQALIDGLWVADQRRRYKAGDTSVERTKSGAFDIRSTYGLLNERKVTMSDVTRHLNMHYWVTTHIIEAGRDDFGNTWATGPNLGSKSQMDKVPAWIEACYWLQGVTPAQSLDPWHQAVYFVDKSKTRDIKTKDRTNICWTATPANLRAILTASAIPFQLRRIVGLEWQDEVMEEIAAVTVSSGLDRAAIAEVMVKVFERYTGQAFVPMAPETETQKHVAWAVSDGLALGTIQHRQRTVSAIAGWVTAAEVPTAGGRRPRPTKS